MMSIAMSEPILQGVFNLLDIMNERMKLCEKCMDDVVAMNKVLDDRLNVVEKFILNGDE